MQRTFTSVELAIAFAVVGAAVAATVPACIRAVRVARPAEATENVEAIFTAALRSTIAGFSCFWELTLELLWTPS